MGFSLSLAIGIKPWLTQEHIEPASRSMGSWLTTVSHSFEKIALSLLLISTVQKTHFSARMDVAFPELLGEKSLMSGQPFQNFLRLIDTWINAYSNVPYNLGICTILSFSESGNHVPILRLHTCTVQSQDCLAEVHTLENKGILKLRNLKILLTFK